MKGSLSAKATLIVFIKRSLGSLSVDCVHLEYEEVNKNMKDQQVTQIRNCI